MSQFVDYFLTFIPGTFQGDVDLLGFEVFCQGINIIKAYYFLITIKEKRSKSKKDTVIEKAACRVLRDICHENQYFSFFRLILEPAACSVVSENK